MKPPFTYYGGKQKMSSKIVPLIPKHTVYVEPFSGAGTVMFAKAYPDVTDSTHYIEYLNDIDLSVYNFFEQLKHNGEELCRQLDLTLCHEHLHGVSKRDKAETLDDAIKFFVNIQQSFCHKKNSGWGRAIFGRNQGASYSFARGRLYEYINRVQEVNFSCTNALKCIDQLDSPQTFFYVDPPYPNTEQGHYKGYTQADFDQLVDKLKDIQGSFILSCYGDKLCDELFEKFSFDVTSSARSRANGNKLGKVVHDTSAKRTEVLYRKFSVVPRPEIIKLYQSGKYDCFVKHPWEDTLIS